MKAIFKFTLLLIAVSTLFVSCKQEEINPTAYLNLKLTAGTKELVYDSIYTINGKAVSFSIAQMYLSNFSLADDEGNKNDFPVYIIGKPGIAKVALGELTLSHIHTVDFMIGVDSATNHLDPTTYPEGHALAIQTPGMHWTWNSGYIFMKLEGKVDNNGDGTPETGFLYHLGLDSYAKTTSVTYHTEIDHHHDAATTVDVCIEADIAKYLTSVDFSTDLMTHTMDNMPLATKITDQTANVYTKGCN